MTEREACCSAASLLRTPRVDTASPLATALRSAVDPTAGHLAALWGHFPLLRQLLALSPQAAHAVTKCGTALHAAIRHSRSACDDSPWRLPMVRMLLARAPPWQQCPTRAGRQPCTLRRDKATRQRCGCSWRRRPRQP